MLSKILCISLFICSFVIAQNPLPQKGQNFSNEPVIFGAGDSSAPNFDWNAAFTPDWKTVYFSRAFTADGKVTYFGKGQPPAQTVSIYISYFKQDCWTEPELASFSGKWKDTDPFLSPDGTKLFFISKRPVSGEPKQDYDIWYVEKSKIGWSEARHVDTGLDPNANESYPTVTRDGTLYFDAVYPEGKGAKDVYRCKFIDGQYAKAESLSFNTSANERAAAIAPDESFIVFSSDRPGRFGQTDLYISYQKNNSWAEPQNLGPKINSKQNNLAAGISPNGKTLYIVSDRLNNGRGALFLSKLK